MTRSYSGAPGGKGNRARMTQSRGRTEAKGWLHTASPRSISAPADFVQDDWIDLLCRTAGQISAALGHEPADP